MPRQDVPYGGAICRLKERIAEIWDKLGEKLHSINGVEGDGQGNVVVRSDSSALSVTSDQLQHEIVLDLDTSLLPAADVNSVNGQTGVVALTADDIPSDNGDVQTDIDNLEAADTTLQGNINAETLARQNADSTLQTNINAATAGIPTEISNQLAADTTIVRTSGNQNISDVKTVATQATGSYSQQIANSQKVKNELDNYAPMVRTTGNQTIAGLKTFTDQPLGHRVNTRLVTGGTAYFNFMNCGLRSDGTNTQILAVVYAGNFGIVQIREPTASSINVTDIIGSVSSSLYFALYSDGSFYHVAVKQRAAESRAFCVMLLDATKGNYALNPGDISLEYSPTQVDAGWTQIATTE